VWSGHHEALCYAQKHEKRNEMEAQEQQGDGMPAPEVIATLLDLARLAHRIELAAPGAPGTIATLLLERLVMLCKAQRGAVLFTQERPVEHKPSMGASAIALKNAPQARLQTPTGVGKTLRILAQNGMHEEEVLALLEGFSSDGAAIQSRAGEPCCVICRLPISAPSDHRQDGGAAQSVPRPDLAGASPEPSIHRGSTTPLPLYGLLVLVWVGNDDRARNAAESAKTLLPFLVDAAGTVMTHLLMVERVHELEAMSDYKALRDMELLKAELLATVSHELRSPLASIKGYAATLLRHERRISREERHEFLLAIKEASDRLASVIDRLFEMSQLETGDIHIELTAVNLAYLVREAITALEQRFVEPEHQERHVMFRLRLEDEQSRPTDEEPVIWADRHRLREVLDNLVDNAIHYSPEGGAIEIIIRPVFTRGQTSRLRTVARGDGGDGRQAMMPLAQQEVPSLVEICVHDQGIGIPPAHLERVFDHFHRVDTRLTREASGIGLGLAICKRIVELHGGTIWAESDLGQGSTFHVWLPRDARHLSIHASRCIHEKG
jgi:signal transduction histidine kinase